MQELWSAVERVLKDPGVVTLRGRKRERVSLMSKNGLVSEEA
jgi:hypothetical protein